MQRKTKWKLGVSPETEVRVDEDVLAMRAPLVRVHRDEQGAWSFDGPGESPRPVKRVVLASVADAWPHVAGLSELGAGDSVVWSWNMHGWTREVQCRCGDCEKPVAADLDRRTWPSDLRADKVISVETAALGGQASLSDIVWTADGLTVLSAGSHPRARDDMTPVALANVIRRWPHTMQALRSLKQGRGMRWNAEQLAWAEYVAV